MARTTAGEVKEVMAPGKDYDTVRNPPLAQFIEWASLMVDDVVAAIRAADETAYGTAKLRKLETLLAAHAYKASDQQTSSRSNRGASGSFTGQTGMGLTGTKYGQLALDLDSGGWLPREGKSLRVMVPWAGTQDFEIDDWDTRNGYPGL